MSKNQTNNSIEEDILDNKNNPKIDEVEDFKTYNKKGIFRRSFNSKFKNLKVKYKKDPKKALVTLSALLVAFSALIGSSYAYLIDIGKTDNSTTINAGNFSLIFEKESNTIVLDGALPINDESGLKSGKEYSFTVKNVGDIPSSYVITLDNTCVVGKQYSVGTNTATADICIPDNYIKVGIQKVGGSYKVLEHKEANEENKYVLATGTLEKGGAVDYRMKIWLDIDTPNTYNSDGQTNVIYSAKLGLNYEQVNRIDKPNEPILSENMIPVYYDETDEVWKKADYSNKNENYKWYDYNNKMWANSVTVSNANRSTYLNAQLGTTIPMDDILTMQVWIPRYKYKIFNYNEDGKSTTPEQKIEVIFENGKASTGDISCIDNIQGTSDGTDSGTASTSSETCKLKISNEVCTDSTCNGKYYTHPAFTFGNDELTGIWVGKFELTGTIDSITTKPGLKSITYQSISDFSNNLMAMNDTNNIYGFASSDDTHVIKNMEWGSVTYLTMSRYGKYGNSMYIGENKEVYYNKDHITGGSDGKPAGKNWDTDPCEYNNLIDRGNGTGSCGGGASTTGNIYGIYDMSGGTWEYVMCNTVDASGNAMVPGSSGFTTYPDGKYYDKYSYVAYNSSNSLLYNKSKLGDGIKETKSAWNKWYDDSQALPITTNPWLMRGSAAGYSSSNTGIFTSMYIYGGPSLYNTSRFIISPIS